MNEEQTLRIVVFRPFSGIEETKARRSPSEVTHPDDHSDNNTLGDITSSRRTCPCEVNGDGRVDANSCEDCSEIRGARLSLRDEDDVADHGHNATANDKWATFVELIGVDADWEKVPSGMSIEPRNTGTAGLPAIVAMQPATKGGMVRS